MAAAIPPAVAATPPPPPACGSSTLALHSKQPFWSAVQNAWCIDFKGRVKVASVKNYQLLCCGDSHDRVAMQFGKVGG